MSKALFSIDSTLKDFMESQPVYFVASAPLDRSGHINLSPKGLDTFRVLGPTTVAYLDLTGSGVETIAHLKENGRIVVMFCAFQGSPKILRLHGRGHVAGLTDPSFAELKEHFPDFPGIRSIIVIDIERVAETCGFGVPILKFESERKQLTRWAESKGATGLIEYRTEKPDEY